MRRLPAVLCTILAVLMCMGACAETILPQYAVDMDSDLCDCALLVSIETDDIDDGSVITLIYDIYTYDADAISSLKRGDIIVTDEDDIAVEHIDRTEDGSFLINGGTEEGGMTLQRVNGSSCYMAMDDDRPAMGCVGQAMMLFAQTVTFNVYPMDESLSPIGEGYDTTTVSAADASAMLKVLVERFGGSVTPYQATLILGNIQEIDEVIIDYAP